MHGICVIGTSSGADELAVANALSRGGEPFTAAALGPASPEVAARLAGRALDPAALLESARSGGGDPLVVATSGGLLAPLAQRYSNRDLARELGLAVVVAAAAEPGLVGGALLAAEGAAGAGLAVAAIVLTGWPDPPDRVLLEERKLLEALARVPVVTLPEGGGSADWPVDDWAARSAEPAPPVQGDGAPPARVTLEPYDAWEQRTVGDPRATPRADIMAAMLEIVGAEGPMTATRAYALYNRASGGRKLTSVARAPLSSAIYWLAQERKVVLVRKEEIPWQDDDLVRMPDSPAVRVRELGPRALEEVPLDEIAELARRLSAARGGTTDPTALKRAILGAYGLVRLTARADEYLGLALDLAAEPVDA